MFEAINHVIQAARRLAPTAAPDIACFGARMLRLGSLYAALVLTAPASAEGVKLFEVPTPNSYPESVAVGPGGAIWFTEKQGNKIGRLAPDGQLNEFFIPTQDSRPQDIVLGPDGNLWFTENRGNKIGRISPAGEIAEFPLSEPASYPFGIVMGFDGALWFTLSGTNRIGRITVDGQVTEFGLGKTLTPYGITAGPDGNLWFTGFNSNTIGRITPTGQVSEFPLPTLDSAPQNIVAGPDGSLWFTEAAVDGVGRITTDGKVTELALPSCLPGSPSEDGRPSRCTSTKSPYGIASSKDALWVTQHCGGRLSRLTPDGHFSEVGLDGLRAPNGIVVDQDDTVWFALARSNGIGRHRPKNDGK
ncbi:Virginiamycin B lyase [Methylobacterium currus]|jgi:virginiamycin B lyase|uniref:Vgb family protein n=1 Tax=Methylobacterium currus TaxID=2051553 RepID=UPI000AEB9821|nr:Virginiamycin B lyase [Methylobacterium currus]